MAEIKFFYLPHHCNCHNNNENTENLLWHNRFYRVLLVSVYSMQRFEANLVSFSLINIYILREKISSFSNFCVFLFFAFRSKNVMSFALRMMDIQIMNKTNELDSNRTKKKRNLPFFPFRYRIVVDDDPTIPMMS